MASVRLGALDLRLVAPQALAPRVPSLQREAGEVFVPAVLRAMERRLGRIYGARAVIRIRRLSIRCMLSPSDLGAQIHADELGAELAAQIAATIPRPRVGAEAAAAHPVAEIYRDSAHLAAAALIAAAERRTGPDGIREAAGEVWARIARELPAEQRRVLRRCSEAGRLERVLAALGAPALLALEPIVATERLAAVRSAVRDAIAARDAAPPPAGAVEPALQAEPEAPSRPLAADFEASPEAFASLDAVEPSADAKATASPAPSPTETMATVPPARVRSSQRDGVETRKWAPGPPQPESERRVPPASHQEEAPSRPAASPPQHEPVEQPPVRAGIATYRTRWGRLLFLVNVALRLELPERLWQVGVDEGAALAAGFALLADDPADCAPRLLHRRFPEPPPPLAPLPQWARAELEAGVGEAASRLWSGVEDGAAVERRITLRASQFESGCWLADWIAAVHLVAAETLLGEPFAPGTLAPRFAGDARIELDEHAIRVVLPVEAIDLDLRRIALDADPGMLVWLDRRVLFEFEGGEA